MNLRISRSARVDGTVVIPGSKSHTIRALFIASLADGESIIRAPLRSKDAASALSACRAFGAEITDEADRFRVRGFGGKPNVPDDVVDVGNSGTTMNFSIGTAALARGISVLTGDEQIRRRPVDPLIHALNELGIDARSTKDNGKPPVVIDGARREGSSRRCEVDANVSQYLSSLLIHAPLFEADTDIDVIRLSEAPYVEMTLWWLDKLGIRYENDSFEHFHIYGNQRYHPFDITIPGDFSSATFFAVLAAASCSKISMKNLDMTDVQGDKEVLRMLERMGARVSVEKDGVSVAGGTFTGMEIDLNSTPDAICAMAVAGCFAEGETRIVNVPQARLKETDRISVMTKELAKMGADIEELDDGLIVRHSRLKGAELNGHGDHRVVMSLAVAGMLAEGVTTISGAEAAGVTFPEFVGLARDCGGKIETVEA